MSAKKILIVDDDADLVEMLKAALVSKGHEVETAGDGMAAMEIVKQRVPSLIILDVMMPKMDGYTFVRELKKESKFSKVPIIILTAREMMRDMFVEEGVQDYLMKPFPTEELLSKIAQYIS